MDEVEEKAEEEGEKPQFFHPEVGNANRRDEKQGGNEEPPTTHSTSAIKPIRTQKHGMLVHTDSSIQDEEFSLFVEPYANQRDSDTRTFGCELASSAFHSPSHKANPSDSTER